MNLKNLKKHSDWVKMWSAKGSFHFDSHFGKIWTRERNIKGKSIYQQVIFFYKNGITDCWATKFDRDDLGNRLEGTHFLRHILHAPFDIADRKKQAAFLI